MQLREILVILVQEMAKFAIGESGRMVKVSKSDALYANLVLLWRRAV
jgi:hypothetical protein